jgi:chorismate mutase
VKTRRATSPAILPQLPRFCALRGATSVAADRSELVTEAVAELLHALLEVNDLTTSEIVSAIFSATADLHSLYPAAVARALGWTDLPMLCVTEMRVEPSPQRCIRVLLHLSLPAERTLRPIYLREARALRPDLITR